MTAKNLMIVQGGGPTPVFNASLAAIVSEAQQEPAIHKLYGSQFGIRGLASRHIIDLTSLSSETLSKIRNSPGAALGSTRFRPTEADLDRCIENLRSLNIGFMVFLGGNGTMAAAHHFREFCLARNFDLQVMGAPKTIDNDISSTDRCPGYGSAARFVAQSTLDLAMDIRSLSQPVSIFETLGRDVGWLAASSLLAKQHADDAPHIICVPEIPFEQEQFVDQVDAVARRIGWAVVVVSEGTCYADGTPVFQQELGIEGSSLRPLIGGVAQHLSGVIAEKLGIRCRSEKPGLLGRSSLSEISSQDLVDAEQTGRECVRALAMGKTGFMISLSPLSQSGGRGYELLPLKAAGGPARKLPLEWLQSNGLAVKQEFLDYVHPIVGVLRRYDPPLSGGTR